MGDPAQKIQRAAHISGLWQDRLFLIELESFCVLCQWLPSARPGDLTSFLRTSDTLLEINIGLMFDATAAINQIFIFYQLIDSGLSNVKIKTWTKCWYIKKKTFLINLIIKVQ